MAFSEENFSIKKKLEKKKKEKKENSPQKKYC